MTRDEAAAELKETFGSVDEQPVPGEPGLVLVIVSARQAVPNSQQASQVAFKLPAEITVRPQHFVEPHLTLPNGTQPNNVSTQEINGTLWKTWSMNSPWEPHRHSLSQLVGTVLKQWDR